MARFTIDRTVGGRTFTFRGSATPGAPSLNYYEPDDPPEVEIESVHEGDVELTWEAFEDFLEGLLGKEGAGREIEAIENAALEDVADAHAEAWL